MIPTPTLLIGYYHDLLMRDMKIDQLVDKMCSIGLLTEQDLNIISTEYSMFQKKCLLLEHARHMSPKQLSLFCNIVLKLFPEVGSQLKTGESIVYVHNHVDMSIKLCIYIN